MSRRTRRAPQPPGLWHPGTLALWHWALGTGHWALVFLLAGCALGATPTPPLMIGQTPTPTVSISVAGAAQATTVAAMATAQAQARRGGPRQRLWLVTAGSGTTEERFGRGIAQSINDRFDGYEGSVEVTTGPAMNLDFLVRRQTDLAIITADTATEAPVSPGAMPAVRALARLYPNHLHLIMRADSPMRSLADLAGRTVATGTPGSATEVLARRALATAGLVGSAEPLAFQTGLDEAVQALREHRVDAVFWLGPAPAEPIVNLFARKDVAALRLVPLDEVAQALVARPGSVYRAATIPAGAYPGQTQPVPTLAVDSLLVAGPTVDEGVGYGVTRAIFDNIRELPFFHPEGQRLTLLTGVQVAPLPFHPGAARFYREKGVLPG